MDVSYGEQVAVAQTLFEQAGAETWVSEPQASVLLQTAAASWKSV
ncbi:hypothetical protein O9993_15105 [Vibrio lentus]|nr:hypothetical protein [Vibrio lentus]